MKMRLYELTYKAYIEAKNELKRENEGMYNELMIEDNDDMLQEWPEFFDPDQYI